MGDDVVGGGWAAGCGEPALAESDEDAGEPPAAGRVVLMGQLAGATGQKHHDWHDEFGLDDLSEADLLEGFRITNGFGNHPRKAKRQDGVGLDAMFGALDRDHIGKAHQTGFGGGVMRLRRLTEHPARRRDEHESAIALLFHHPVSRLAEVKSTVEVDPQHARPIVMGELVKRDAVENAGIADNCVKATERFYRGVDDGFATFGGVDGMMRRYSL